MIVYLLVRRLKQNVFLEADESDSVSEVKQMLEGILKVKPGDQRLYLLDNEDQIGHGQNGSIMQDDSKLNENGIVSIQAKAQTPARIGLAIRNEQGNGFEALDISSYSNPPPLPDIMKSAPGGDDTVNKQ